MLNPKNKNLFTYLCVSENLILPESLPDIEQIITCLTTPEILSVKTINTMKGLSCEGQNLTGLEVLIEFSLKQKVLYAAGNDSRPVHIVENECIRSAYLVIPKKIEGTDPGYLIRYKYLKPEIAVEDTSFTLINKRSIYGSIYLIIQMVFEPGYEICYSVYKNCGKSNLYLLHEDGVCETQITFDGCCRNEKPVWSPKGDEIGFLSDCAGVRQLYTYSIKSRIIRRITDPKTFSAISGFCWAADGKRLCFTEKKEGNKDIHIIDSVSLCSTRLTYSENMSDNFKPLCSPNGLKIGFIRKSEDNSDLRTMNMDGSELRDITNCENVECFDWATDSKKIAYVCRRKEKPDDICVIDIEKNERYQLSDCPKAIRKRKVLFSPDECHLAFIGADTNTENIFLFDIKQNESHNITNYGYNVQISDLIWKIDGSKIYFASNERGYFNLYSASVNNYSILQLTNTDASNMKLDYRPRLL